MTAAVPAPPPQETGVFRVWLARARSWFREGHRTILASEERLFFLLAIIIGLFAGLSVVCFRLTIEYSRILLLGAALYPPAARIILVPAAAGLVIAFLVIRYFPQIRGSGVNQTKAAVYIFNGYISFKTVIGKFFLSALAIGSGQSLGPEDPSLQIGAGIASVLGRRLRLSRDRIRLIAPVGASAGLAAAFNTPITAVLFVIEEIIGNWSAGVLGAIVLSAGSAVVVARWFLGDDPLFRVPEYQLAHPAELISYAVLGVIAGYASVLFVKLIAYVRPRLARLPQRVRYLLPAAAGLIIGTIGLAFPQVMGAGYEFVDQALHGQYIWQVLALLAIGKILATVLSFSSGAPGGLFAPTLFIGAMLGGAVGGAEQWLLQHSGASMAGFPLGGSVGSFALVGMGTMFAGILRVPITSVFMILEVTGTYSIILPLMISNTIAYLISRQYQRVTLFDLLSRQDGTVLPSMEEKREEMALRVEDAMRFYNAPPLRSSESVRNALQAIEATSEPYLLVRDELGWNGLRIATLQKYATDGEQDVVLQKALNDRELPTLHPDEPLETALSMIQDRPLLPVVHRTDLARLEGVISLEDILQAYRRASKHPKPAGVGGADADAGD